MAIKICDQCGRQFEGLLGGVIVRMSERVLATLCDQPCFLKWSGLHIKSSPPIPGDAPVPTWFCVCQDAFGNQHPHGASVAQCSVCGLRPMDMLT